MTPDQMRAYRPIATAPAIANDDAMTYEEALKHLGEIWTLRWNSSENRRDVGELVVEVIIREVRKPGTPGSFRGRIDVLVEPAAGSGQRWVNLANLEKVK